MSEIRELYQQMIIDHGRHPRNFGEMSDATAVKEGFNPMCGDKLVLYLQLEGDIIKNAQFEGAGCAISVASASLMTENLKGKTVNEAKTLFNAFHNAVMKSDEPRDARHPGVLNQDLPPRHPGVLNRDPEVDLGKLEVLTGVAEFPARVKCATLAWHTMISAIENNTDDIVSTE